MLRVAVLEDEPEQREQLRAWFTCYEKERGRGLGLTFFSGVQELTEGYRPIYDIMLLEVHPPELNGLEAARAIRAVDRYAVLLLMSQQAQYAVGGYEVEALDYLLRPASYEGFAAKLDRAVRQAESSVQQQMTLLHKGGAVRLRTRDIYYVEIQDHMLHYHTAEGEYVLRGTMQGAVERLRPWGFARCNHWYLVNLLHVREVQGSRVLVGEVTLEVSRRSRTAFLEALERYSGQFSV